MYLLTDLLIYWLSQVSYRSASGRMQWRWINSHGDSDAAPSSVIYSPWRNYWPPLPPLSGVCVCVCVICVHIRTCLHACTRAYMCVCVLCVCVCLCWWMSVLRNVHVLVLVFMHGEGKVHDIILCYFFQWLAILMTVDKYCCCDEDDGDNW